MSGCAEFRDKLEAHALGFLAGPERDAVDAHLQTCVGCRDERDDIGATLGLLEGLPGRLALGPEIHQEIARIPGPRRVRWSVLAAAAGWLIAVSMGVLALWMEQQEDPRLGALATRVELQASQVEGLRKELIEDRDRQSRERDVLLGKLQSRLDRQDELLRSLEEQGRRWAETSARVNDLGRELKTQERRIQDIGEGTAALVRRSADDSERLAQVLRELDRLKPREQEKPKPEIAAATATPPAPGPGAATATPETPRENNPVEAAQGFLWSVFRDRGGALNQKIRAYKEDLNRSYDNK